MTLAALHRAVAAADTAPIGEAVGLIRPFLDDIGWFAALLAQECGTMAADPLHLPGFRASCSGSTRHLVFARTERIWMSATIIDPGRIRPSRVHFSGRHILCRPLNRPMRADGFRLEGDVAVPTGDRSWPVGAVLDLDERRETVRVEPGDTPLMLLRAQVAPAGLVSSRVHDAATGARLASAQVEESHARALMLLSLLRVQGRGDAATQFAAALDSPLAAQRWAVMREYLALDTRRALAALHDMARAEPDAAVRALAQRTLAQVGAVLCPA